MIKDELTEPYARWEIKLTDEEAEAIRDAEAHGVSFRDLVKGLVNMAAPYGQPNDNSDIQMERDRLEFLASNHSG